MDKRFFHYRDDACWKSRASILLFGRAAGPFFRPGHQSCSRRAQGRSRLAALAATARLGLDRPEHGGTLHGTGLARLEVAVSCDYGCRARATSWRSVTRRLQASPDCLCCLAELRRPRARSWPPRFPLRHELFVVSLRLGGNQHLAVAQRLDVIGIGRSTP